MFTDVNLTADTAGDDTGKQFPIGLRVSKSVRESLEKAAAESGRSLSAEVMLRLERSFDKEKNALDALALRYGPRFAHVIVAAAEAGLITGRYYGSMVAQDRSDGIENWDTYPTAYQQATAAILEVLKACRPPGGMKELPVAPMGADDKTPLSIARDVLAKMGRTERQAEVAEEMLRTHKKFIEELDTLLGKPEYHGAVNEISELLRKRNEKSIAAGTAQFNSNFLKPYGYKT